MTVCHSGEPQFCFAASADFLSPLATVLTCEKYVFPLLLVSVSVLVLPLFGTARFQALCAVLAI